MFHNYTCLLHLVKHGFCQTTTRSSAITLPTFMAAQPAHKPHAATLSSPGCLSEAYGCAAGAPMGMTGGGGRGAWTIGTLMLGNCGWLDLTLNSTRSP